MAYAKPAGYNTGDLITRASGARNLGLGYRIFNNAISGSQNYAPGAPSARTSVLAFSAAPANLSQLVVPDTTGGTKTFTFTYAGSPGPGIIPLVAGGGTAAQASVATLAALLAQLVNWTGVQQSATAIALTYKTKGLNPIITTVGVTNINFSTSSALFSAFLPARVGGRGLIVRG